MRNISRETLSTLIININILYKNDLYVGLIIKSDTINISEGEVNKEVSK